jgi:hypothetical protein
MHTNQNQGQTARFRTIIAAVALVGGLMLSNAGPARAEMEEHGQKEGAVTVYTAKGGTMQAEFTDKAMLDKITAGAQVLGDHTMVVMHNGKFYLVADKMTDNGKTVFGNIDAKSMH